jgi:hypothetical protein
MEAMTTVTEVIAHLRENGYVEDFNLQQNCLVCRQDEFKVFHDEFVIDKVYRFEGNSDPGDEATVYAISCPKYDIKGVLVNGAGIYSDPITDQMLNSLQIKRQ